MPALPATETAPAAAVARTRAEPAVEPAVAPRRTEQSESPAVEAGPALARTASAAGSYRNVCQSAPGTALRAMAWPVPL